MLKQHLLTLLMKKMQMQITCTKLKMQMQRLYLRHLKFGTQSIQCVRSGSTERKIANIKIVKRWGNFSILGSADEWTLYIYSVSHQNNPDSCLSLRHWAQLCFSLTQKYNFFVFCVFQLCQVSSFLVSLLCNGQFGNHFPIMFVMCDTSQSSL